MIFKRTEQKDHAKEDTNEIRLGPQPSRKFAWISDNRPWSIIFALSDRVKFFRDTNPDILKTSNLAHSSDYRIFTFKLTITIVRGWQLIDRCVSFPYGC